MVVKDICGLGTVCVDTLVPVDHLPHLDEAFLVKEMVEELGGVVATAMITASRLGSRTGFVGAVGTDAEGKYVLSVLGKEGVETGGCKTIDGDTSHSVILIDEATKKRSILFYPGIGLQLAPESLDFTFLLDSRVLHIDGLAFQAAKEAALGAKREGVLISLDAGAILPGMEELICISDILIPNEKVAQEVTGSSDPARACEKLFASNKKVVAITLGDQGAVGISKKGEVVHQAAFQVPVEDTTGAGDSFHGAFLHAFLQGWDMHRSLEFSCAVAALVCTRVGGIPGIPDTVAVEDFLEERGRT